MAKPAPTSETGFLDVVNRNTGKRAAIPAHWWGGPFAANYDLHVEPDAPKSDAPTVVEEPAIVEPDPEPEPQPVKAPAKSAAKDDWIAWAVHSGAAFEDADAMTQDQLIKKYGR